jgi:hypothetical protein
MVYSIIFIVLAAICNAVMDKITHHWDRSIFKQLKNSVWWNPSISWKNKYVNRDYKNPIKKIIFGLFDKPFTDAWHTFKSLMIVFLCLAICTYKFYSYFDFIILGTIWNLTFNLLYNKVLKK